MKERTQETAIVPTGETTAELIPEPAGLCLMRLEDIIRNRMEDRLTGNQLSNNHASPGSCSLNASFVSNCLPMPTL